MRGTGTRGGEKGVCRKAAADQWVSSLRRRRATAVADRGLRGRGLGTCGGRPSEGHVSQQPGVRTADRERRRWRCGDQMRVVSGRRVSLLVGHGGRRIIKQNYAQKI